MITLSCHIAFSQDDLSGEWRFKTDPEGKGLHEKWYNTLLDEKIKLPGSLQEQGFGNDITIETPWVYRKSVAPKNHPDWFTHPMYEKYREPGNLKFPYWLQPAKHYIGMAWFQKDLRIDKEMAGKNLLLTLERCHIETRVWINERELGSINTLAVPHRYTLPGLPEGNHILTICVDNTVKINVGPNAHSISDHTQTNWNGIIGEIAIQPLGKQHILHANVYPSGKERNAKLILELQNTDSSKMNTTLITELKLYNSDYSASVPGKETSIVLAPGATRKEITIDLGEQIQLWDEFGPNLYSLILKLTDKKGKIQDSREITFGVRDIRTEGTQFILNGRKVFMRGTLECAIFPLTGYPSMDVESWRHIYRQGKAYGLNHFRFHSWCPPEAAFVAADLEGVYLQPECSVWAYAREDELKNFIRKEAQFILREYGNHPSFVFLGYGNEAGVPEDFMEELLAEWKKDSRHLYTGPANANITPSYDFAIAVSIPRKKNPPDPFSPGKLRYQDGWPPLPQYSF
ncbi:MAG: beta-galactosidase, partial [Bacteroidales bacterium]|nr:beta-galactosidase [Bacteroidales bacterium]